MKTIFSTNKIVLSLIFSLFLLLFSFIGCILVSDDVVQIISDKCAVCHTTAPSSHLSYETSEYQCASCHVPFPDDHSTSGCTASGCHDTPEKTHFNLRDDDNQTQLKADVEDECIDCHLNAVRHDGRGFPALTTNDEIIATAQKGTLRSWIQPGGFMAKYLTDSEISTITSWVDSISANRVLDYDPYLDAVKINTDFDINGKGDNSAWGSATEHIVTLTSAPPFTATDQVKLKALYSDSYLYIRAEYNDSTLSMTRSGSWAYDSSEGSWSHPPAATENDKQSEDRFSFFWNMSVPDYKATYGCAIKCHGNIPGSSEFTDEEDTKVDIWHSKAARSLCAISGSQVGTPTVSTADNSYEVTAGEITLNGYIDDKYLVWYMDTDDGYDTEDSGRRGDEGSSAYSHNRNDDKSAPKYLETSPDDYVDAMVLTQAEIDAAEVIVANPDDAEYAGDSTVAAAWANYEAVKAVVPEMVLRIPSGRRGDVLHAATWKDGVWISEVKRKLSTGSDADDVQFSPSKEYEFSFAVFDNCGRGEIPPGHNTYGNGQYQVLRFK